MRIPTLLLALALLVFIASAPSAQILFNSGTVISSVYGNGNIGGDCSGSGNAFNYNGDDGLCGAGFLLGFTSGNVVGDAYILTNATGWSQQELGTPTSTPIPGYTGAARAVFTNAANNVSVELNAYYDTNNPDVVVYIYEITNTGSTDIPEVYPGLFFDWDVGGNVFADNLAAVDTDADVMYVWDPTGATPNYFGAAVIGDEELEAWRFVIPYPPGAGQPQSDPDLFQGLSQDSTLTNTAADQRGVIGSGPVSIPAGETAVVSYALAAGTDADGLLASLAAADGAVTTRGEESPESRGYALAIPSPNPLRASTTLSFRVPEAQHVRLEVLDALGRLVATPASRAFAGGSHTVSWDAGRLRSGVYTVRLSAGGETLTRRATVVR
ncbi:MAG: T9SS type A sorting domain-containing protein [Bacteroidota bacterium]